MVRELLIHHALLEVEEQEFKGTPLGWALSRLKPWPSFDSFNLDKSVSL
jgi:hypothetical protein